MKFSHPAKLCVFEMLVECARKCERCPTGDQIEALLAAKKLPKHHKSVAWTSILAREGMIRIHVGGHNWRVVEILHGPDAGAKTMADPTDGTIYRVIDKEDRWLTKQ